LLHLRPGGAPPRLGIAIRLRRNAPGVARARVGIFVSAPLSSDAGLVCRPIRRVAVCHGVRALERPAGRLAARYLVAVRAPLEPPRPPRAPRLCPGAPLCRLTIHAEPGVGR